MGDKCIVIIDKLAILDNSKNDFQNSVFLHKLFYLTSSLSMVTKKTYFGKRYQHSQKRNTNWKEKFFISVIKTLTLWIPEILVTMTSFLNYIISYDISKKKSNLIDFKWPFKLGVNEAMCIASRFFCCFEGSKSWVGLLYFPLLVAILRFN